MASKYAQGRAFEYRVRDDLIRNGCGFVIRSAGSKGCVDLCGFGYRGGPQSGRLFFVQCKRNGKISGAERLELVEVALDAGAIPLLASPIRGGVKYYRVPLIGEAWYEWEWS